GHELVYLYAQGKLLETVLRDHTTLVSRDQFNVVRGDHVEEGVGTQKLVVHGDREKTVMGHETTTISLDRDETVGSKEDITIHVSRTEQVDKSETLVFGATPADMVLRSLETHGTRETHIELDDTTKIGGNQVRQVMGALKLSGATVSIVASKQGPADDKTSV